MATRFHRRSSGFSLWKLQLLLSIGVLLACTGCSNLVQVQGEVTLDGQPLPNAKVMFMPQAGGRPAEGTSDAAGKFRLTTNSPNDGAAAGEYVVTVTARTIKYEAKPGSEEGFVEKATWQAPERFSQPSQSGLKATVSAAKPQVEVELKSP